MKRLIILLAVTAISCGDKKEFKKEELSFDEQQVSVDTASGLRGSESFKQMNTSPNSVLLTGMDKYRLIPIYKLRPKADRNIEYYEGTTYRSSYMDRESDLGDENEFRYFMPGMDLIYGYNLINIAHYDMESGRLSYFFPKPALIRAVYFPGVKADSLAGKPISRDFFLVSAYESDTNKDSLINKKDMRRLYHIDAANKLKTSLLPPRYSAIRSTYDYKNDVMYVHARFDANDNGRPESSEPVSIFWISLKTPSVSRRMI